MSSFKIEFKRDTSIMFTAVDYGTGDEVGQSPTSLSTISHDHSTGTYRVVSRFVTGLFAEGVQSFDAVGNAYLAFKRSILQLNPIKRIACHFLVVEANSSFECFF